MQIDKYDYSSIDGLAVIFDVILSTYYDENNDEIMGFTHEDGHNNFRQCKDGFIIIFLIGEGTQMVQMDIRLDEIVPPADNVLHAMQVPFEIQGDAGINIEAPYGEFRNVKIPQGQYLLTVHQCYAGNQPFGPPRDPEAISTIESIRWLDVSIQMQMWFNPVDTLGEIIALSHWNWPGDNT
jgi:hypothetical protein